MAGLQMCMYVYKQTYTYTLPTTTILDNMVIHAYNSSNLPTMVEYFHQCFYSVLTLLVLKCSSSEEFPVILLLYANM